LLDRPIFVAGSFDLVDGFGHEFCEPYVIDRKMVGVVCEAVAEVFCGQSFSACHFAIFHAVFLQL
jgi:hypothetical protein